LFFKLIIGIICGTIGWAIWRQAARWKADGIVPSEWNDGAGPAGVRQDGPDLFIGFQKGIALLSWFFALLCAVSLVFFPEL
jgi:hypothetical protein